MRIFILVRSDKADELKAVQEKFESAGFEVVSRLMGEACELTQPLAASELTAPFDYTVVLGGDGSILKAVALQAQYAPNLGPIVSFNLGHLGFLAHSSLGEVDSFVAWIKANEVEVESRPVISYSDGQGTQGQGINEIAIEKRGSKMLNIRLIIDGQPVSSYGCDAMIISTPTGSTAHAFSAGGPVIWPEVRAIEIVPIAAHTLFSRPLIVSADAQIEFDLLDEDGRASAHGVSASVTVDGHNKAELPAGSHISISLDDIPHVATFVKNAAIPFASRLVEKFQLPTSSWRG